jgi:hypothetical protein
MLRSGNQLPSPVRYISKLDTADLHTSKGRTMVHALSSGMVHRLLPALAGSLALAALLAVVALAAPPEREGGDTQQPAWSLAPMNVPLALTTTILAPSAAMGDFGANHGNVWDMNSLSDIVATTEHFPIWQLPSEGTVIGGTTGATVQAFVLWGDAAHNFPAIQYHHLVYRLKLVAAPSCWTNGRVAYSHSWPGWGPSTVVSTFPFVPTEPPMSCPWGNFCIYYLDLARNDNSGWPTWHSARPPTAEGVHDNPSSWVTDRIRAFGIVPNEWCLPSGAPDHFEVDFVYLAGEIVAREQDGYHYVVQWNVDAPELLGRALKETATLTSTLRYRAVHELLLPNQSPACDANTFDEAGGWRLITRKVRVWQPPRPNQPYNLKVYLPLVAATGGSLAATDTYDWQLANPAGSVQFQDGESYYVCVEADDGISPRAYTVSSAPVIRAPLPPVFGPD